MSHQVAKANYEGDKCPFMTMQYIVEPSCIFGKGDSFGGNSFIFMSGRTI
jgi:hypothetical protein